MSFLSFSSLGEATIFPVLISSFRASKFSCSFLLSSSGTNGPKHWSTSIRYYSFSNNTCRVNRGSEILTSLSAGTLWESVAKEVGNTLGMDSRILRAQVSKEMDHLVSSWIASNVGPKLLIKL
ncbi:hypothetical protein K1719_046228 [Acacia pycnantha]|nr:hypothetical protein K1719_046228 [Acacia pycnantha]